MKGFVRPIRFWSLFFFLVLIAFVSLWQRDRIHRVGYTIQSLQHEKSERMKLHNQLLIEVERLNALDRIEAIAATELAMEPASPGDRIYMKASSGQNKN